MKYTEALVAEIKKDAFLSGMLEGHRITFNAIVQVKSSIENVQSIYDLGEGRFAKKEQVEELQTVWNALEHLEEIFESKYEIYISNHGRNFYEEELD